MTVKIAIDFDGTVCRSNDDVISLINFRKGTNLTAYDWVYYDGWETHKDKGITRDDFYDAVHFHATQGWLKYSKPYDERTTLVLDRLFSPLNNKLFYNNDRHYEAYILTQRPKEYLPFVEEWFEENCLVVPKIVSVENMEDKLDKPWDILMDDAPVFYEVFMEAGTSKADTRIKNRSFIGIDCPWNKKVREKVPPNHPWIKLMPSWRHTEKYLYGVSLDSDKLPQALQDRQAAQSG